MHYFTSSWWKFLSFLDFSSLCSEVLIWVVFSLLELTIVMMHVFSRVVSPLLLEFWNWSPLYFAVIIFLEADHIPPNFGILLWIASLIHWHLREVVRRWVELAAMRSFIDLKVDDFLISVNKMLIIILIFQAVCKRILLYISSVL